MLHCICGVYSQADPEALRKHARRHAVPCQHPNILVGNSSKNIGIVAEGESNRVQSPKAPNTSSHEAGSDAPRRDNPPTAHVSGSLNRALSLVSKIGIILGIEKEIGNDVMGSRGGVVVHNEDTTFAESTAFSNVGFIPSALNGQKMESETVLQRDVETAWLQLEEIQKSCEEFQAHVREQQNILSSLYLGGGGGSRQEIPMGVPVSESLVEEMIQAFVRGCNNLSLLLRRQQELLLLIEQFSRLKFVAAHERTFMTEPFSQTTLGKENKASSCHSRSQTKQRMRIRIYKQLVNELGTGGYLSED